MILKEHYRTKYKGKIMARYDKLKKPTRDKKLIEFARDNPELSVREIGRKFRITGQRVSQILKKYREGNNDNPDS